MTARFHLLLVFGLAISGCSPVGDESSTPQSSALAQHAIDPSRIEDALRPAIGAEQTGLSSSLPSDRPELYGSTYTPIPDPEFGVPEDVQQQLREAADDHLRGGSPKDLWNLWIDAMARANREEMELISGALGESLRNAPDEEVYLAIEARLFDPTIGIEERLAVLDILRYTATPRGLESLLDYWSRRRDLVTGTGLSDQDAANLDAAFSGATGDTIRMPVSEDPNWSLSPVLERAWSSIADDAPEEHLTVVADGLSHLSTEQSVSALLEAVPISEDYSTPKTDAALKALTQTRSIDALPPLRQALDRVADGSPIQTAALEALVSIGAADASIELVEYLRGDRRLSDAQIEELELTMTERSFPSESIKVFEEARNFSEFTDARVPGVLERVIIATQENPPDGELDVDDGTLELPADGNHDAPPNGIESDGGT